MRTPVSQAEVLLAQPCLPFWHCQRSSQPELPASHVNDEPALVRGMPLSNGKMLYHLKPVWRTLGVTPSEAADAGEVYETKEMGDEGLS